MSALIGGASYFLYSWSHSGGHADADGNVKRRPKKNHETGEKQDRKTGHFALDKWLKFGGGYYGTAALVTLILSEIAETFAFLTDWQGMIEYFSNIGFHIIVDFFVNQLQMFLGALLWFVPYLEDNNWFEIVLMFGLTYGAYRWAQNYARMQHQKPKDDN